jgi:hypothetical protein
MRNAKRFGACKWNRSLNVFFFLLSFLTHRALFRTRRFESIFKKESFKRYAAWSMLFVGLANYLSLGLHLGLNISLLVVPIALFGGILILLITYGVGLWLFR